MERRAVGSETRSFEKRARMNAEKISWGPTVPKIGCSLKEGELLFWATLKFSEYLTLIPLTKFNRAGPEFGTVVMIA